MLELSNEQSEALDLLRCCYELTDATIGEFVYGSKARAVAQPKNGRCRMAGRMLMISLETFGKVKKITRHGCPVAWQIVQESSSDD